MNGLNFACGSFSSTTRSCMPMRRSESAGVVRDIRNERDGPARLVLRLANGMAMTAALFEKIAAFSKNTRPAAFVSSAWSAAFRSPA